MNLRKQYLGHRNNGTPALAAWRWAHTEIERYVDEPEGFSLDGREFEVDGFDISIRVEPDDSNDYSFLGEFSDNEGIDSIKNPEAWNRYGEPNHNYLAYFTPAISEAEHFAYLHKSGMDKQSAHLKAREIVIEMMNTARDYSASVLFVTASRDGIELGSDVLGGIDYDDPADAVWDHDMIDNAIGEAKAKLAELIKSES
jgi:hypothetical protein